MIIVMSKGYKNQHFMKNNFHSEMYEKFKLQTVRNLKISLFFFLYFSSQCIHIINIRIVSDFKGKQTTHTIAFDALSYAFRVTDRIR